ncbi:MAG: outer membrane protein assembly factor BamD [Flavobacteriaceae bacterium]|nr:outer membrane protein assembly factor BamD [Flavobacteriaceae bacterium]
MQKLKKLLFTLFVMVLLSSCGEYNKVLNKGKNEDRYKMAVDLYEKGEYKKAIPLFEKLVGPYAGKPQMERIQYMTADSYYNTENYSLASYYFSKFIVNYASSTKVEEAAFLGAKSYYLASPKYSRDQQDTQKALTAYQEFIDTYPDSELIPEANKAYTELISRLEKKDFEIAKQYYHTENYTAAITAFDTFNEEHLGSQFKEDALYYKFKASYDLGMKSILSKKEQRLLDARLAYSKFNKSFPDSDKKKEVDNMFDDINKELEKTKEELATISQNN